MFQYFQEISGFSLSKTLQENFTGDYRQIILYFGKNFILVLDWIAISLVEFSY